MDKATVMHMLSLIPERVARRQSGAKFEAREGRAAHLGRFLNWMSPLNPLTKDDQVAIGYNAASHPRADDAEGDEPPEEEALAAADEEAGDALPAAGQEPAPLSQL